MKKGTSPHTLKMWMQMFRIQEVLGEVVEMVLTTGDVDVVEGETHFSSASAQILISEIVVCNRDLEQMKKKTIHDVQKRLSNIIDILGKI
ncbi:hypothetical protein AB205_0212630 [Aquarana catesbeiana]|uniref:Uncharacterized protein n=1 Tax=Aquarana catesbeiana TaxID=8400 RepID=A0A2G9RMF3_AQUCT|nr:hypothetical protein AB205_0212630 [Aquarana catesbeiana]